VDHRRGGDDGDPGFVPPTLAREAGENVRDDLTNAEASEKINELQQ
jgi:hypothetical protein